jgi:hypothetical protein
MEKLNALTMKSRAASSRTSRDCPFVAAANPDVTRQGAPNDTVLATDIHLDGLSILEPGCDQCHRFQF